MKRRVFLGAGLAGAASAPWLFTWGSSPDTRLRLMSNGVDYVIARDIDDARMIVADVYGYGTSLSPTEITEIDWEGWNTFEPHEDFEVERDEVVHTQTVSEWIAEYGNGYFAHLES